MPEKCDRCKNYISDSDDFDLTMVHTHNSMSGTFKNKKKFVLCRSCFVNLCKFMFWTDAEKIEGERKNVNSCGSYAKI